MHAPDNARITDDGEQINHLSGYNDGVVKYS
jgi:hypothetical protein